MGDVVATLMLPCEGEGCDERVRVELHRGAARAEAQCPKCGAPSVVDVLKPRAPVEHAPSSSRSP